MDRADVHVVTTPFFMNADEAGLLPLSTIGRSGEDEPSFGAAVVEWIRWVYIFLTSGWAFAGFGLLTLAVGVAAYFVWRLVSPPKAESEPRESDGYS